MTDQEFINQIAQLTELEYQRNRKEFAADLDLSVTALDKVVREARKPGLARKGTNKLVHGMVDHTGRKIANAIWKGIFK